MSSTSPSALAKTLIQRFDTVAEDPDVVVPTRELVHETFEKGFGSYWHTSDHEALPVIERFAQEKLPRILPVAGHELPVLAAAFLTPPVPPIRSNSPASNVIAPMTDSFCQWANDDKQPSITNFHPLEFAQQLAIRAMEIFRSIRPEELLESKWVPRIFFNIYPRAASSPELYHTLMVPFPRPDNTISSNTPPTTFTPT
ncbi:hypothetical protein AOQ84DRAFT_391303 [Glonium stellatum]|uniref:Uncharacterized protein n=1 Tax=Glonium stellatum TaxID=574774 RepID=A0A8E2ETY7_9PEZI|nr:hypothetical protein AOQ84DRAFT_391303 [Glonium stellatum]